jgi:uncharacterized circularly permuted ATP-grasp superfamily protein
MGVGWSYRQTSSSTTTGSLLPSVGRGGSVVYRRTDDAFLDPEVFRPDSMLRVRGLMRAWARGNVALANAPGTVWPTTRASIPSSGMIRFYLGEEPLLAQVPTYQCSRPEGGRRARAPRELVVKVVDGRAAAEC